MKKLFILIGLAVSSNVFAGAHNEPDSVYLFSYATTKNSNHNGLHFAWSRDGKQWQPIGNEYPFVKSDYGRWGSQKRMLDPYVVQSPDGQWHAVWALNEKERLFAAVSSPDLVYWGRQTYHLTEHGENVQKPVLGYNNGFSVYYASNGKYYRTDSRDLKTYSAVKEVSANEYQSRNVSIDLPGGKATGQQHKVAWSVVANMLQAYDLRQFKDQRYAENTRQDAHRFADLKPVKASIVVQAEAARPISDLLFGVFFEDLNYAADGGLYAELIQNRDFEYALSDKENRDPHWNSKHSWSVQGTGSTFNIDSAQPIHPNNPHYAVLETSATGASLVNSGFDGIVVRKGEKYVLSAFLKGAGKVKVNLVNAQRQILASAVLAGGGSWKQSKAVLTASADATDAKLELQPLQTGRLQLDMISLFPQATFKGHTNGLRADLAQTIADMHPRFVRFPGGCVAHGDGLHNIYQWKNTVGPLEARKPQRNLWGYHQSAGLGYYEYFRYCEDMGAEPLPVIAAGVPCQNSGEVAGLGGGQQGGVPFEHMDEYIQDILDLVEYANGTATSKWGKVRAAAGHPKPFNLKYVGIGNEDLISDVFAERYKMILAAMKKHHPEIVVIGTVGPFSEGTDYVEGWKLADSLAVPMVDEHYYQPPGWFIHNQDYYDRYDRSKSKVYLGEYAAHLPGRPNNIETALAEALYLTTLERNGDVVHMSSYAPLLAKEGHTQWNPDLIYFNNSTVKPTVGYHVQSLYGRNAGNEYLPGVMTLDNQQDAVKKRVAYSVVRDQKTKDVIVKLVNLLPVPVSTNVNLNSISPAGSAVKTVLQGRPDDKTAAPVTSNINVQNEFSNELPPYSFTVIRIKTK
ncbi:alpha-L-arabinofuranosidase [Chitinophaga horti]|uniref:non-reducing end alpha-L-arabinofuranosidase n=1 Tax=Chitinophaga horti TaxID=2920382 RepID=A0ABY6J825_9BACT|nr:alpha-L-arabinofuranosidase C-terminal domain-containing protein [Chitinophaga horti]UYQ95826.1 alpha-L-arabinofuranosidase [Chitinophaga horti]